MSRRLLTAGRVLLWGAVGLVWIRGALTLLPGTAGGAGPAQATAATAAAGTFPREPATAVAVRFAQEYLTVGGDATADRSNRLRALLPDGAEPAAGWDGAGSQRVSAVVPVGLSVLGPGTGVATVAARTGSRWLHVAVPLTVRGERIVVPDLPAFVPGPWPSEGLGGAPLRADPVRTGEVTPALESFFRAYAGGSPADLSYFAAPGRTLTGLGGLVELAGITELRVGEGAGPVPAVARVRWTDRTSGAGFTQTYRLMLVERDGRWYVDRLGAGPAPSGKEA